ncbi:MAG: hypothetical protein WAX66_04450 [Patescibacteria group bacterium]
MFLGFMFKNIILGGLFALLFVFYLFPVDLFLEKLLGIDIKKTYLLGLTLISLFIILCVFKLVPIFNIFITFFIFGSFLVGFSVDEKYMYTLALLFLGLTVLFVILKLSSLAEYTSTLCYLCMVLGIIRDLFYEKVFKN